MLAGMLATVAALAILLLPAPQTVFVVSARTETLSLTVTDPDASSFGIARARLVQDDARECVADVSVKPDPNSLVQYARFGAGPLTITVGAAPAQLFSMTATSPPSWAGRRQPPTQFVLDPDDPDCPSPKIVRLPLFGSIKSLGDDVVFDDDLRSPRLVLISGVVRMLVRAIDFRLLFSRPSPGAHARSQVFYADEMQLPAGGVMRDARTARDQPADWWGFVDVVFGDATQRGFQTEASSHAASVSIDLPAVVRSDEAGSTHELSVDFVQRWTTDPTLRLAALVWGAVAALVPLESLYGMLKSWLKRGVR